ncbi:MAG: hypothetical protein AB1540_17200 [Bdellovibrionota bacterium]
MMEIMKNNRSANFAKRYSTTRRQSDLDSLLNQMPPAFESFFIEEPKLLFAGNFTGVDPKVGIEQYGPFSKSKPIIRIGIIGSGDGINTFRAYLDNARRPIRPGLNARGKHYDPLVIPDFPGVDEVTAFRTNFVTDTSLQRSIPEKRFEIAVKSDNVTAKLRNVIELVIKELEVLADSEPEPDVVVVIMPPIVERECAGVGTAFRNTKLILTPPQRFERKLLKRRHKTGQEFFPFDFSDASVDGEQGYWNFHHALKAHAMKFDLPTQLVWEGRLGQGRTQDPASVAWNLFTALYYKAGNIPWQLQHISPNTCYVGISFYKESPLGGAGMQTSLAQVFSGAGEGLVLKGGRAIVDKKRDLQPHLDDQGAERLLQQAIALYEQHNHNKPSRVVVHKTSRYWPEELSGFKRALEDIYLYDFLTLEKLDARFMRIAKEPPIRGTVIALAHRHYAVYTVGYIPYFRAYPGMRIPIPLEIVEHHGDSPAEQICRELIALTKVNWNSCAFASSEPITIQFARTVGRILTEMPMGVPPQTKYKFYM